MKLDYAVMAENAFFSDSKKLNIINIFDVFIWKKKESSSPDTDVFPPLPSFSIAGKILGAGTKELLVEILSPTDPLGESPLQVNKISSGDRTKEDLNFTINVPNLVVKEPGDYFVRVRNEKSGEQTDIKKIFSVRF